MHKFHCFLFGAIFNVFYQGWEFAHLISEWIACFLSKNELMSDSLKKMSNSSQSLIWFERNERMSKWATSKWANYQPCFLPLKKTLNVFFSLQIWFSWTWTRIQKNCWIRIRIQKNCWIPIRIKWMRIHSPGFVVCGSGFSQFMIRIRGNYTDSTDPDPLHWQHVTESSVVWSVVGPPRKSQLQPAPKNSL